MHPVLSLDGQWLAFNARGDHNDTKKNGNENNRQVYVANLGRDLKNYFKIYHDF